MWQHVSTRTIRKVSTDHQCSTDSSRVVRSSEEIFDSECVVLIFDLCFGMVWKIIMTVEEKIKICECWELCVQSILIISVLIIPSISLSWRKILLESSIKNVQCQKPFILFCLKLHVQWFFLREVIDIIIILAWSDRCISYHIESCDHWLYVL